MYTELLLGDMTLRVAEGEAGSYRLTVLVADNERAHLSISEDGALVEWLSRSYGLAMANEVRARVLEAEIQRTPAT